MFIWGSNPHPSARSYRGVAQLVAHTAGGREVASSSLVTPTKSLFFTKSVRLLNLRLCASKEAFKSCHPDQELIGHTVNGASIYLLRHYYLLTPTTPLTAIIVSCQFLTVIVSIPICITG